MGLPLRRRRRRDALRADRGHARHLARRHARRARPGTRYGFRADGPWEPARGLRFNPDKLLLDPYARAIDGRAGRRPRDLRLRRAAGAGHAATAATRAPYVPQRVVVHDDFDWGDDRRPDTRVARHRDLRAAREGHDRPARPGPRAAARHVRRARRTPRGHRLPARPRRDRGRAAAGAAVRHRAERDRRAGWRTTGATTRSASSPRTTAYCVVGRPRRAGARVQGDGARASTPPGSR